MKLLGWGYSEIGNMYQDFIENPTPDMVLEDVTCSYLSSGVHFKGRDAVIQHFCTDAHEIEMLETKLISEISTKSHSVLETATKVKFLRGPGAFLPGLSLNFVADEVATIYLIHIIEYELDAEGEPYYLKSIKYSWDQATLLKQLNVIGSRGNAWPIYSGLDQSLLAAGTPRITTKQLREDTPAKHGAMRSWPASRVIPGSAMDPVPVPSPARVPPSPSAKPPVRTFYDLTNQAEVSSNEALPKKKPRPQSAYMAMGGTAAESEMYKRVIAGGRGKHQQAYSKPSWAA